MLKRQNVNEKLNNVTMYDMEGYGQTVGEAIVAARQSVSFGGYTPTPSPSLPEVYKCIIEALINICL